MNSISPPLRRGMKQLERSAFQKIVTTWAIQVPIKKVGVVVKNFSDYLFNQPRLRNVEPDPNNKENKIVLLKLDLDKIDDLPVDKLDFLKKEHFEVVKHTIELDYAYWSTEQILHAVMPEDFTDIPSSFTQVGHIAHMNLRDQYLPWKHLIGQVILDKNKAIKTVVNKTDNIDTTFRFFKMELLAGEDNMIAEVKESGCRFNFDFSKVYWNSRLHTEHDRLIQLFKPTDFVCDVFAGVGPFAIPSAKKGTTVYANDLNPVSHQYMLRNIQLNKIKPDRIFPYNLDGRAFIRQAVKDLHNARLQQNNNESDWKTFDHFVMNLPATAIEFLDTFRGLFYEYKGAFLTAKVETRKLPTIHCHCFTKDTENPLEDIAQRIADRMGEKPDLGKTVLHWVRNVAPKKDMYCISFPLSHEVAFAAPSSIRYMFSNFWIVRIMKSPLLTFFFFCIVYSSNFIAINVNCPSRKLMRLQIVAVIKSSVPNENQ
ncbi:Met-10+ like-protein-domain-containing protein [Mycotypha africana]|uniref:Met-10+ like-protein-domain-containing protein n=1 Tax=Mycotypha africana TaxID=64632 RepID=UPI0023017D46|nr:Met-10+ like-protein-domain-containing protein [Mycotypha africana]KAI8969335.1 Met-10+ like-protein-domain-containing protein [Mycotypha africana]